MPIALYSAKIDGDGRVRVIHIFLASNEGEARKQLEQHAAGCAKFGPAVKEGNTIDIVADVDQLPEADEDSISEFLDLEDEEDEEEEPEEEGEEEPEED